MTVKFDSVVITSDTIERLFDEVSEFRKDQYRDGRRFKVDSVAQNLFTNPEVVLSEITNE